MTKSIVFYDDIDAVVRAFWADHLRPALSKVEGNPPLLKTIKRKFVPYYQSAKKRAARPVDDVVKATISWLGGLSSPRRGGPLEKVVFLTDLAPEAGKTTPDTGYGFRVIRGLASDPVCQRPQTRSRQLDPLTAFLADQRFVVILHTAFPDHARRCIEREWPTLKTPPRICTVPAASLSAARRLTPMSVRVQTTLGELKKRGPRFVLADRVDDEEFLAQLIVKLMS